MPKITTALCFLSFAALTACAGSKPESDAEASDEKPETIAVSGTLYIGEVAGDLLVKAFVADTAGEEPLQITDTNVMSDVDGAYTLAIDVSDLSPGTNQALIVMTESESEKGKNLWSFHEPQSSDIALDLNLMTSLVYELAKVKNDLTLSGHQAAEEAVQEALGLDGSPMAVAVTDAAYVSLAEWFLEVDEATDLSLWRIMEALAHDVEDGTVDGLQDGEEIELGEDVTITSLGVLEI